MDDDELMSEKICMISEQTLRNAVHDGHSKNVLAFVKCCHHSEKVPSVSATYLRKAHACAIAVPYTEIASKRSLVARSVNSKVSDADAEWSVDGHILLW